MAPPNLGQHASAGTPQRHESALARADKDEVTCSQRLLTVLPTQPTAADIDRPPQNWSRGLGGPWTVPDGPPIATDQKVGGSTPSERATPDQGIRKNGYRRRSLARVGNCTELHMARHDDSRDRQDEHDAPRRRPRRH